MPATNVIVFDVNETLSDLESMAQRFTAIGMPAPLAMTWFAQVLRDGFALAAAGTRDAADESTRSRLERRRQRQRSGLRRYRPGPGRTPTSPTIGAPGPEQTFAGEIQAIRRALDEHGTTERREVGGFGGTVLGSGGFPAGAAGSRRRRRRTPHLPQHVRHHGGPGRRCRSGNSVMSSGPAMNDDRVCPVLP